MERKVVVTGMGTLNSLADNVDGYWKALLNGKSGVKKHFIEELQREYCVGLIHRENTIDGILNILWNTCEQAFIDANIVQKEQEKIFVLCGTSLGGLSVMEELFFHNGDFTEEIYASSQLNFFTEKLIEKMGGKNQRLTVSSTCSSGLNAVGMGYQFIKAGLTDKILVLGYDFVSDFILSGIRATRGLSMEAIKPFDVNRNGMVLGDGTGALILEDYDCARKRNANVYAEVAGYRSFSEAYHLMVPDLKGVMGANCLKYNNITSKNSFLMVSSNGTKHNDQSIYESIASQFDAEKPFVSGVKAQIGHTLGASGIIEGIATIKSLKEKILLPLFGVEECEFDLNYVKNPVQHEFTQGVNLSTSFGGNVASVLYKEVEQDDIRV